MSYSDDWMAMQYVLGELPDTERAAFEERMADDLAACEAVARASRLVLTTRAALSQVEPLPAVSAAASKPAGRSWIAFVATSVAVALLCVLAVRIPTRSSRDTRVASLDPAAELVSLWRSGMSASDADQDDLDDMAEASADMAVPTWLLAAVSLEVDGQPEKAQEN